MNRNLYSENFQNMEWYPDEMFLQDFLVGVQNNDDTNELREKLG